MNDERFLGRRILSGVWMTEYDPAQYAKAMEFDDAYLYGQSNASVCLILLDGRIWRFMEDPDDGYRSSCHDPQLVTDVFPINWWQTSERVHVYHAERAPSHWDWDKFDKLRWWLPDWMDKGFTDDDGDYISVEHCDYLVLVSEITDKPVLTVGTSNTDDYYPSFVAHFEPENMSVNSEQRGLVDIAGVEREEQDEMV